MSDETALFGTRSGPARGRVLPEPHPSNDRGTADRGPAAECYLPHDEGRSGARRVHLVREGAQVQLPARDPPRHLHGVRSRLRRQRLGHVQLHDQSER